jgi:hypothetical protein
MADAGLAACQMSVKLTGNRHRWRGICDNDKIIKI